MGSDAESIVYVYVLVRTALPERSPVKGARMEDATGSERGGSTAPAGAWPQLRAGQFG